MVRHQATRVPPIGFAHRGARALAPENTLEAFTLARKLGATGLESDVWLTADGEAVLDHDGIVGSRIRRRRIRDMDRASLPAHIPTLEDLYATCGNDFDLSLDIKDDGALERTVAVARAAGAPERLWVCHWNWQVVAAWREPYPDVRLVDSTRLVRMKQGPERRAAQLADAGIDAVNLHRSDWSGGLTTLFHRFDRMTLGWDCQLERHLDETLHAGIDAVYSDHVDRMVDAINRAYPDDLFRGEAAD
jgi:glycerophosphoryl diester phosphodiesterase